MLKAEEFVKAKDYAYKLLSYRQRSIQEVRERLKKKGFNQTIIGKTVAYLSKLNYLNDEDFAKFWMRSKMQSSPVGWALLRYQLRQKGVSLEVLEKVLSEEAAQYNELEAAKRLIARRRLRYKALPDQKKVKKRLYDCLRRRGFSSETILQTINNKL